MNINSVTTFEELDSLAAMVSPEFSPENTTLSTGPRSAGSISYGSDCSEYYRQPQSTPELLPMTSPEQFLYQSNYASSYSSSSPTGSYYSPPAAPGYYPQQGQAFFPPNFAEMAPQAYHYPPHGEVWNQGLHHYIQSEHHQQPAQFVLSSVGKAKSGLKTRRRASRSKCPCVKCCHARANTIPSPSSHGCMVHGCRKTYTRPAHLRAHLKSHETDSAPKCEICLKTVMSADLFILHMFAHGQEMKL